MYLRDSPEFPYQSWRRPLGYHAQLATINGLQTRTAMFIAVQKW